ncbi:MAG: sigma 54-interacting transcriptional regulator [Planctomycetota bacterium]
MKDDRFSSEASYLTKIVNIIQEPNVSNLLILVMSAVVEISGAKRGFLVLLSKNDSPEFRVAHNIDESEITTPQFEVSRTVLAEVLKSGKTIRIENAMESNKYSARDSVQRLGLLSVLAVPLKTGDKVIGAIYLDNTSITGIFDEKKASLVTSFASKIAVVVSTASQTEQLRRQNREMMQQLRDKYKFENLVCASQTMFAVLDRVARIANTSTPVLITGESGTGKELIARSIHYNSNRAEKSFVPVNCGAIPASVIESELFGYVPGAFTGASGTRAGLFETANKGTIFLDEIGEFSAELQVKLLRVLQDGEIRKVGSDSVKNVDVRVISATNKDILSLIKKGVFREDLYYRLNGVKVEIPPLRERREDIALLIEHITKLLSAKSEREKLEIEPSARALLLGYDYPGNVRELEHILQGAAALAEGIIKPEHLPSQLTGSVELKTVVGIPRTIDELNAAKEQARETVEMLFITEALHSAGGNISEASRQTGMNRSQLQQLVSKHGISTV